MSQQLTTSNPGHHKTNPALLIFLAWKGISTDQPINAQRRNAENPALSCQSDHFFLPFEKQALKFPWLVGKFTSHGFYPQRRQRH